MSTTANLSNFGDTFFLMASIKSSTSWRPSVETLVGRVLPHLTQSQRERGGIAVVREWLGREIIIGVILVFEKQFHKAVNVGRQKKRIR